MEKTNNLLDMVNINKSFPGVKAVDNVSIHIGHGQVVALLGANGAGKSTLMKILSGAYATDSGEIYVDGRKLPSQYSPIEAKKHGIGIIYQELSVLNELTVAENIYILNEPHKKGMPYIKYKKMNEMAREQLKKLGIDHIDVTKKTGFCSLAEKQMIEIAKALAVDCKLLIMDEPTTPLTHYEIEGLFKVIKALKEQKVSIIYISHRLDEIFQVADEIIVMRDGRVVGEAGIDEVDKDKIVNIMTGKELKEFYDASAARKVNEGRQVLLKAQNISDNRFIKNLSFELYENEVLGIAGLVGSQRTELFRMISGADKMASGEVYLEDKKIDISTPSRAIKSGIGYLSENRKEEGLNLGLKIKENIVITNIKKASRHSYISDKRLKAISNEYIEKLKVKGSANQLVSQLSGGNQQKVAIAKWLYCGCRVIIFDEPTRGVDVGAKAEIYKIIREFANEGKGAIVISSEVEELSTVCDRVLVMSKGEITNELIGDQINEDYILKCITHKVSKEAI